MVKKNDFWNDRKKHIRRMEKIKKSKEMMERWIWSLKTGWYVYCEWFTGMGRLLYRHDSVIIKTMCDIWTNNKKNYCNSLDYNRSCGTICENSIALALVSTTLLKHTEFSPFLWIRIIDHEPAIVFNNYRKWDLVSYFLQN